MDRKKHIEIAQGFEPADLVLKNAQIANVFTGQIIDGDIAIFQGRIVGIGSYQAKKSIDLHHQFVVPGLIEAHFHIESSMATPLALSKVLLEHGVCTVIADPHEIVNAAGKEGLDFMLENAKEAWMDYFFMIPSSVPSCDFEVNGAGPFYAEHMKEYVDRKEVLGLAEVMRMNDVLSANPEMMEKIDLFCEKIIDGHAPGLSQKTLQAYRLAGIMNDHEARNYEEAIERLQNGFQLFIREGSGAKDLKDILGGLLAHHILLNHCSFCTDDKHIEDILLEGTIDEDIRQAIALGCNEIQAIRMATINTAAHYGLKDRGAIAPGFLADLVIVNNLKDFSIQAVVKDGEYFTPNQIQEKEITSSTIPFNLQNSVHLPRLTAQSLTPKMGMWQGIELVPEQLYTKRIEVANEPNQKNFPSEKYNLLLAAERYGKTGEFAICPLANYGLKNGAIAMSYAHDSHNVVAAADNIDDLLLALETLQEIQGGIVLVENGKVFDALAMEVAGLMSSLPAEEIAPRVDQMKHKMQEMGIQPGIDPFAHLSFVSLPVIPEVRLCPQGLYEISTQTFLNGK